MIGRVVDPVRIAQQGPDMAHNSNSWCHSRPLRASPDISMPSAMPT